MKYLFDTDTVSTLLKPRPPEKLVNRIALVPASDQFISAVTILEITYGAFKSGSPEKYLAFLEQKVIPRVRILPVDATVARIAGNIRAELERNGHPISPLDLQIAATARANGCILITGNIRHFEHVPGLEVEDWIRMNKG